MLTAALIPFRLLAPPRLLHPPNGQSVINWQNWRRLQCLCWRAWRDVPNGRKMSIAIQCLFRNVIKWTSNLYTKHRLNLCVWLIFIGNNHAYKMTAQSLLCGVGLICVWFSVLKVPLDQFHWFFIHKIEPAFISVLDFWCVNTSRTRVNRSRTKLPITDYYLSIAINQGTNPLHTTAAVYSKCEQYNNRIQFSAHFTILYNPLIRELKVISFHWWLIVCDRISLFKSVVWFIWFYRKHTNSKFPGPHVEPHSIENDFQLFICCCSPQESLQRFW